MNSRDESRETRDSREEYSFADLYSTLFIIVDVRKYVLSFVGDKSG